MSAILHPAWYPQASPVPPSFRSAKENNILKYIKNNCFAETMRIFE